MSSEKGWTPANPQACQREIERAARALDAGEHGPTGDEALAILEQQRCEDAATRSPQAALHLVVSQ
ncbi:hypothetical protein ACIPR8_07010 [Stenotrophomonas sp. LARHCG68]